MREILAENNVITISIWDFLLSNGETLLAYLTTFSGQLFIFGEASSSNFFRVTVSTQQSLFWSSYFFRVDAFLKGSVFKRFISLNQLFFAAYLIFQSETSTEQPFLDNRKFLRQLVFGTATFLRRNYLE